MTRPAVELNVALQIEFIEISEEETVGFDAGICLLLRWIKEAKKFSEASDERLRDVVLDRADLGIDAPGNALAEDRIFQDIDA